MHFTKYELNLYTSLFYKIITCLIGILIPRLFILSYGSDINGLQSSVTQFFTYIALIESGVGDATVQALFGPLAKRNYNAANGILSATTYYYNKIGFFYLGLLFLLSILYPLFVEINNISFLTVFLYVFLGGLTTGINFFYQSKIVLLMRADGNMYYFNIFTLLAYILTSAVKIWLIMLGENIVLIQFSYFLINVFMIYCYYKVAKKEYSWIDFHSKPNLISISQKNSVLIHKITGLVFNNTDVILLTFICNLKVVSIYTIYKMVINMVTTLIASFVDSLNYKLGQCYNNDSLANFKRLIDSFNVGYSVISFALFTIASLLLLPFLKLYTKGMDMNYIFPLLPYLYIIIEVLQVGREAMMRTSIVAGHFKETRNQSIWEMILNLVFTIVSMIICKNIWGVEAGLYGALLGTVVALLYRTIAISNYANREILLRSPWKTYKVLLINFIMYIFVTFLSQFYNWDNLNSYFSLIIAGFVLLLIIIPLFAVIQFIFNQQDAKPILDIFLDRVIHRNKI